MAAAAAAPMATEATQPPSGSPAANAYPRWVLFEDTGKEEAVGSCSAADVRTLVTARTSAGHLIGVSLRLASPPAVSSICVRFPPSVKDTIGTVLAAYGNSVLIYVCLSEGYYNNTAYYFVYNAGAASAEPPRPPSLSLLPPHFLTKEEAEQYPVPSSERRGPVRRWVDEDGSGLLRRG